MVEPIGFTSALLAIPGVFTSCVDCFNYVAFARAFGKDFLSCQIRIETAKICLERWGRAVGVPETGDVQLTSLIAQIPEKDQNTILQLLGWISSEFDVAKERSERYLTMNDLSADETQMAEPSSSSDEAKTLDSVRKSLKKISDGYKRVSVLKKTRWALYEKDRLEKLVDEITSNIAQLQLLVPAKEQQQQLVSQELAIIKAPEDATVTSEAQLMALENCIEKEDPLLKAAVARSLQADFDIVIRGNKYMKGETQVGSIYEHGAEFQSSRTLVERNEYSGGFHQVGNVFLGPNSRANERRKPAGHISDGFLSHMD